MKYIPFGMNDTKVSQIIIGLMRTAQMSTKEVATLTKKEWYEIYLSAGNELP